MSDVKHPDSNRAGRMPLNWSKTFAVAFLLALAALGPLRGIVFPAPFSRMPGAKAGGTNSAWEGRDAGRAAGGVFSLDRRVTAALWGTRIESEGADAFTGEVKLECAAPDSTKLVIPVSGRTSAPNMLRARVLDANGSILREWMHPGHDFAIEVGRWEIEAPAETARVELILIDTMSGAGGWLGVGKLSPATEASRDPVLRPEHNFGFFLAHAVALAGFLFMPGLAMRAWIRRLAMPVALLPLPGFALAAATGLAVWLTDPAASAIVAIVFQVAHVAFAILVLSLRAPANNADERHALRLYWALVSVTLVWSIVPLTVEREYHAGTNQRGRMVASPPDCSIPFLTAAYFLDDSDAGADHNRYFGSDWTVTSRGPLSAWLTLAGLKVFNLKPQEPPHSGPNAWPADREGYFVSRIAGILTNALVIFGAFAVLQVFAPGRRDLLWFGLGWVALSPVVMINTAFLWPKMLATYFGLLAIAEVAGKRRGPEAGLWLALSYLAHPVGVLIAAPVILWNGILAARGPMLFRVRVDFFFGRMAWLGLWMIVFASPWLLFKFLEGRYDVFLRFPLGDGRNLEAAANLASWLACRWDNIWYSLMPGALWHSDRLVTWAGGLLSMPGHWAMNCAKTLPFGVGIAMFVLLLRWLPVRRNGTMNAFRIWVIGGGFLLMVLVWGFSRDGLGRNCLEPLVVFAILATTAVMSRVTNVTRLLAALLALEAGALLVLAYLANPEFHLADAPASAWVLIGVTVAAWAMLAWLALSRPRGEVDG